MELLLANPRGFCAGVERAIEIVEEALRRFGAPVYVRHEVVHNRYVVENLREQGAVFIEDLADVPEGAILIFSAHGIPQSVRAEATRRRFRVFDATCPLVTKVHSEVVRQRRNGDEVILIGHAGHPEVEGTLGQAADGVHLVENEADVAKLVLRDPQRLAYVTQTTLSVDDTARVVTALRARFPAVQGPKRDDICYATQNRQEAVRRLARECDLILVVGSQTSSNSTRLCELARNMGVRAHMIDGADDVRREWLDGVRRIGLTAGASAPELLLREVVSRLREWGVTRVEERQGEPETIVFPVPKELRGV